MAKKSNPFAEPMVFLRVGWMDRYQGIAAGDTISRGGAYVVQEIIAARCSAT